MSNFGKPLLRKKITIVKRRFASKSSRRLCVCVFVCACACVCVSPKHLRRDDKRPAYAAHALYTLSATDLVRKKKNVADDENFLYTAAPH